MSIQGQHTPLPLEEPATTRRTQAPAPFWTPLTRRLAHLMKWLRPGMRVKRWGLVSLVGIMLLVAGVDLMFLMQLQELGNELNRWLWEEFGILLPAQSSFFKA